MDLELIFKALADGNRLRIINLLLHGELCVCEIEKILGLSQTNVSRHLIKLSQAGIMEFRKEAQWVYYRMSNNFSKNHASLAQYLKAMLSKDKTMLLEVNKLSKKKGKTTTSQMATCRQA